MDDDSTRTIGRRLREIRAWRGMTQKAVAELAGFSESYLSRIEHGQCPVERRSTLEALAAVLEVAPGELVGSHEPTTTPEAMGEVHAAVVTLRVALADNALDDPADEPTGHGHSWPSSCTGSTPNCGRVRTMRR